jgi:hypothetical protein
MISSKVAGHGTVLFGEYILFQQEFTSASSIPMYNRVSNSDTSLQPDTLANNMPVDT